jgi:hypothetical protein
MRHHGHGNETGLRPTQFAMRIGRVLGPVLALAMYFVTGGPEGLGAEGRAVALIGALMAVMWMTEALPLPVTSLMIWHHSWLWEPPLPMRISVHGWPNTCSISSSRCLNSNANPSRMER